MHCPRLIMPALSPLPQVDQNPHYTVLHKTMFGGSGPHTKRPISHRTWGPKAPIRRPSVKAPVRKLSSVVVSLDLPLNVGRGTDVFVGPAGSRCHRASDDGCRSPARPCGIRGD